MKILACQYSHIEGYPPTFNAVNVMASQGHTVYVLMRKDMITKWSYHENIKITYVGDYEDRFEFEKTSKFHKIKEFFVFLKRMRSLIKKNNPDIVLLYDNIPLMAYSILKLYTLKKNKVWYHNHDSNILSDYKKFSLNYFAFFFEKRAFKFIDFFTIPQLERFRLFNLKKYKGLKFVIPNYPPKYLFKSNNKAVKTPEKVIKLIYPGNINENIGIENVIPLLGTKVRGCDIYLKLIGDVRDNTKRKFIDLAEQFNVRKHIFFEKRQTYLNMPKIISEYHIGLAMYKPANLSNAEAGTAANKIYEYAALGLPVILNDTEHYRKYLDVYKWTFFFNSKKDYFLSIIDEILDQYELLSFQAKIDFSKELYFEKYFLSVFNDIVSSFDR